MLEAAEDFYLRTWAEPAVDVNGIAGGEPQLQKTVLPVSAEANVSIRLAPGQDPDEIAPVFERLAARGRPGGGRRGGRALVERATRPDATRRAGDPARAGRLRTRVGARPLLIRVGGTLPIVPALADKGIPTVLTGFDLPEGNIHSPNERLLVEHIPLAVAAAGELYRAFAQL